MKKPESRINKGSPGWFAAEKKKAGIFMHIFGFRRKPQKVCKQLLLYTFMASCGSFNALYIVSLYVYLVNC